jgi:hypothetical protein
VPSLEALAKVLLVVRGLNLTDSTSLECILEKRKKKNLFGELLKVAGENALGCSIFC